VLVHMALLDSYQFCLSAWVGGVSCILNRLLYGCGFINLKPGSAQAFRLKKIKHG
jgi:hypothetical protein